MRTKIYVGVLFETEHYSFGNDTAKAIAKSVEILLENHDEEFNKLLGAGHQASVYDVSIQEQVQTGAWNRKVDE